MGFSMSFLLAMIFPLLTLGIAFGSFYYAKQPVSNMMTGGFRTELSTSSRAHWEYANRTAGKLFLGIGILLTIGTLLLLGYLRWSAAQPNWEHLFYAVMAISILLWLIAMAIVQLRLQRIPPPTNPELDQTR